MKPTPIALGLAVVLIIVGATTAWWLIALGFFLLIIVAASESNKRKGQTLRAAPSGATRVETVKQQWVNQTLQQYSAAGWQVVGQSSAKSFGSQARVTITFKKA